MKKGCFNLRQRSRWLLVSLLALLAGGTSPAWAGTITENFESLTVDGTTLSNGWFVQGGTLKSSVTSITSSSSWGNYAGEYNYEMISRGANGTSTSICNYESSNTNKYLIVPVELTGKIRFYVGGTRTSGTRKVELYRVSYNSGVYSIGTKIGSTFYPSARSSSSAAPNWLANKQEADLGTEHTMVAFLLQGSAIDEFEAEEYVFTPYVEPATIAISDITGYSAEITWTAGETDETLTGWNLEYKIPSEETWTEVHGLGASTLSYALSNLDSNTSYDVRVNAVYGSNESGWKSTTFKTAKVAVPATGFVDDFETNKGWDFVVNGNSSNAWVRGTATNNGGIAAMYISNDSGSTNAYATSGAMVAYAAKLFSFEAGDYTISYDWKANGESTYDYLRVALVPATDELTTTYTSIGTSSLPTGWIELDGGSKLNLKTAWQSVSKDITITEAASYQVVFAWRNDGSGGSNPPAAIDNFKILGSAPVLELSGDVVGTTLDFGSVSETTNKTITITNSGKVVMENIALTETSDDDNVFAYATLPKTSLDASESMDVTVTFSGSSAKDYTGTFRVSADDCDPIDVNVTATYSNSPASIAITIAEDAVGESVAFGSVGKEAVKTFTVTNDGDQTLNVTIASNNTTDFTVSPAELAVTGHSSETFTVTFVYPTESPVLDAEKTANITVTPSNEGLDAVTFAVTGTRIEQWSEDFSGNALSEGWTNPISGYTAWTFSDGVAYGNYANYKDAFMQSPLLRVEEGQSLTFLAKGSISNSDLYVYAVTKNGTTAKTYDFSSVVSANYNSDFTEVTIDGLDEGSYYLQFKSYKSYIKQIEGFKLDLNDPKMGVYSDAECTAAVATSVNQSFGFATETQTATYYIKNDGTGTMTLSLGDTPDGITQSLDKTSVAAGEHATLTITMPAENKGYNGGNVVVTATDLGTFTVAVSGVIVEEGKLNLNFATDNIPTTWTTNSWSKNASGYVEVGYSSSPVTLQTSNLTAVAGEDIVVLAKMTNTYSSYSFGVKYKKTDAEEWSNLIPAANIGTSYVMLHGTIDEAGTYQLQFNGQYTQIQRIYGLSVPQEPVMVVYDGENLAAATYNFGNVSDEADATWTLTVKNEGQAELTGLAAALTGDDADHYSVEVSATTIAVNGTATITVKQLKDNLGAHTATLTVSATGLDNQVITLSGNTYDHTKQFVDFEDGNLPTGWTKGSYWNVSQVYGQTNHSLGHSYNSSSASSVVTTPLAVAENEVLTFGASRYYSSNAPTLKVRYTADGGLTWSDYTDFSSEITSSYSGNTFKELTLENVPAGTVILEFYGSYVRLDNIYGFTATTAPVFALKEGNTAVANNSTKEFGTLTAAATATYVLSNTGNGDLVSTLSSDVVTFEVTSMGEDVTLSENTLTIPAGKSATIVVTMPYAAPFEAKNGSLTITSTGWVAPVTLNYTATLVDETALYEDFAGNAKPAGWYQESSGWLFTQGAAHVYTGVDKEIITEKYGAEDGKNVLSFDAKRQYTSLDGELKVYTSTDRQEWTLAKTVTLTAESQTVTLDALADGEYYVKFVSLNASIDNLAGLKKLTAPEHDLYVTATTFPTTTLIPETENGVSASATVYSLRADETGVVAKLFFDEEEVATVTHSVDVNDYYTFSLTCNVPATEKTYAAKIVVYYSDNTVAWESQTTNVVVSQTRTLQITDFARTSDETVDADANNQFTSTFNVTVQNNGTVAQDAANVSVSITDADGNVIGENATSWTVANSQTMFIVPGEYANDNAVLAIYRFNTNEDAEWAELTKISDNLYSTELNNKANFIIVRLKNSENDGYVADNNGLNWSNMYNQSVDITPGTYNCFTFKGWDDKNGDNHYFDYSTMAQLPVGASITMSVSVTTSALEGGLFTFKAKENLSNTVSTASATVTVNAAAPKFELAIDETAIENGDDVAYGIVKAATTKTFTISNTGSAPLLINSINVPEGFTYSDGEDSDWKIYLYNGNDIDGEAGTFKKTATEGVFVLNNLVIPGDAGFEIHTSDWSEKYAELTEDATDITELGTRTLEYGQKYKWLKLPAGTYGAVWNYNTKELTFREAGIPAGETADVNVTLKAEQGKVNGNLTFTYKVDATTNSTFNVALSGRSVAADTWTEEFASEIPATWTINNSNSDGWKWNDDRQTAYSGGIVGTFELITPRLAATANEVLTYETKWQYDGNAMTVQYSTDKSTWTDYATITASTETVEREFVAPTEGNYYLKFIANRYVNLDNFVGFQLNIPEHDTEIAASSVPETGKQYNTYTATVTLKESVGKAEEVTASLYVNGEAKATEALAITANGSTVVTLTWEPQEVISEAVEAYVAVTGTGIELATEPVSLTIAEVYTLDEATSESTVDAVEGETILLKRTFVQGWNTVCLPFAITNVEAFFGEGAKAFDFTGYNTTTGEVNFTAATTLTASYPYVVYVPEAITEPMKLQNITISSSDNYGYYRESNDVKFQGSYAPIAAGEWGASGVVYGVTSDGHIRKAGASASMKGFRAYFDVPSGTEVKALVFDGDEATAIEMVNGQSSMVNEIYNVAGQRVQKMQKGINIVNGKKIMK